MTSCYTYRYQRQRLSYEAVNTGVADFNRAVGAKYRLMSAPTKTSEQEIKKYQLYKSQENQDTEGEFFVTGSDLKELSDLKGDNKTKIILTCLRHTKRIKEIRGPVTLIRYAVVKNGSSE